LAQAATTKQFNVKDEIEQKDEFDGNPDIEELKSLISTAIEKTVVSFISGIKSSDKNSGLKSLLSKSYSLKTLHNFCAEDWIEITDPLRAVTNEDNPIRDLHRNLDVGSNWEFASVPGFIQAQEGPRKQKFCKAFSVSTALDSTELSIKLLFSQTDSLKAFRLAGYLNNFMLDRAHYFQDPITTELYHYTHATSDYPNLVIVTRLPRGSLDSLLAKDAK